jgi:hypothetical protein
MAKVIRTEPARVDLGPIYDHIAQQSQSFDLAERICDVLLTATYERLAGMALVLEAS